MKFFRRFWRWLISSTRAKRSGKAHPDLYPLDVELLSHELRLLEQAERLGKARVPAPDAKSLSGPEAAIVQRVEKARQDYIDWAVMRLNTLSENIARRTAIRELNRARHADREFDRTASGLIAEHESLLRILAETARNREAELGSFRTRNQLSHEADYPTASGSFLRVGILFVLIVVEGLVNARFFAEGLNEGLLGGFAQAGMLAAMNVIIAFMLGKYFVPYLWHLQLVKKIYGMISLAFAIAVMCAIGMGIAHYRDSLVAGVTDPGQEVLRILRENPLSLRDVFSWMLFGVSMSFAVGSLADGLYSDDLYPGYGKLSRRARVATEDYEDELQELRNKLEVHKEDELNALESTLRDAQSSTAAIECCIADKKAAKNRLATALRDADNSLDALLHIFRTENEVHRGEVPRPPYFDAHPDLRPIQQPEFDTSRDEAALLEQRVLVATLIDEVQDIRGRIQAAFTRQFDRLNPLDMQFPDKESV
jgi:hypothetical protein